MALLSDNCTLTIGTEKVPVRSESLLENVVSDSLQEENQVKPLFINVAVFTAKRGYDWINLPKDLIDIDEADALLAKARSIMPDSIHIGECVKGVLWMDGYLLAFVHQIASKWDQAGRDVGYCACAIIRGDDLETIGRIKFGDFLEGDFFRTPSKEPPSRIEYETEGEIFLSEEGVDLVERIANKDEKDFKFDLNQIGAVLRKYGSLEDMWLLGLFSSTEGDRYFVRVDKNWEKYYEDGEAEASHLEEENAMGEDKPSIAQLEAEIARLRAENDNLSKMVCPYYRECIEVRGNFRNFWMKVISGDFIDKSNAYSDETNQVKSFKDGEERPLQ